MPRLTGTRLVTGPAAVVARGLGPELKQDPRPGLGVGEGVVEADLSGVEAPPLLLRQRTLGQEQLKEPDTGFLGWRTSALLDCPDGPDREVSLGGQLLDRQTLSLTEALHELPEPFSSRLPTSDQPDLVSVTHTPRVPQIPTGSDNTK